MFILILKFIVEDEDDVYVDFYVVKWISFFVMFLIIMVINIVVFVIGFFRIVYSVIFEWSKLFGGCFFSFWVLVYMYLFVKGFIGRRGRLLIIVWVWLGLVSIMVFLFWIIISFL